MPDNYYVYQNKPDNRYGFFAFIGDLIMTVLTCGVWLLYVFVREMRRNR